jgi:flagella basal body P-ring formation protein FlgA
MNLLTAIFLIANLGGASVAEADKPADAVRELAKVILGSGELLPSIPESVFAGLPNPGEGITFAARPFSSSTAGDVFPVELSARRNGRVLARRHFVFPFARGGLVVVARRVIEPGEVINALDLALVPGRQERGTQKTYSRLTDISGQVAKMRIPAGRPITNRSIRSVHAVKRGEDVTVRFEGTTLRITMKGRAIQNGSLGETVRVMNVNSKRMFDARVVGAGMVEISNRSQGRM